MVVETSKNGITVLTSDGQFLFIPIKNSVYMVGEQITLPDLTGASTMRKCTRRHTFSHFLRRRLLPIAAVASLILCASFFGYTKYLEARPSVAWVTIDLVDSPGSMELEVNDRGLIKSVTYFDEESQRLASSLNLYMKPVDYAVEALLKDKQECGQPEVVIGIIPMEEDPSAEDPALNRLEEKILKDVQKAAEKAAKKTAKAAEKAAKEAAKAVEKAQKDAEKAEGSDPKSPGTKKALSPVTINHIRLDRQTRDIAKELKVSAARAMLWALSHHIDNADREQDLMQAPGIHQHAVQSGDDDTSLEAASGLAEESQVPVEPGNGKPGGGQTGGANTKQPPGQSKDDTKPKAPPGQAKKQADFRSSIPKLGIEKIKEQSKEMDKHYLSELAKEWAEKVKEAQKSKNGDKKSNTKENDKQGGKPSSKPLDNKSGSSRGDNQPTSKPSNNKPDNSKSNNQQPGKSSNNKAPGKPSNNKPGDSKSSNQQTGKSSNDKSSKTKHNWPTWKPRTTWPGTTIPWGK